MLLLLSEFFMFGTVGFWLLFGVAAAILAALSEAESPGWATITFIVATAALSMSNGISVPTWVASNPLEACGFVALYLLCGVLWSLVKWWRFLVREFSKYKEQHDHFMKLNQSNDNVKKLWKEHIASPHNYIDFPIKPPQPSDHKKRIITWMAYWPWSALWTLFDDPIREALDLLFDRCVVTYEKISNRVFASIKHDLE